MDTRYGFSRLRAAPDLALSERASRDGVTPPFANEATAAPATNKPAEAARSQSDPNAVTNGRTPIPTAIAATEPPLAIRAYRRFACRDWNTLPDRSQNCVVTTTVAISTSTYTAGTT